MRIERLHVEEGFLDGLDLELSPGLNVIIGARGVGKTSILELLRYVLRLPHVDQRRAAAARQHAEAILGRGRAVVTYIHDGQRTTIARSAADPDVHVTRSVHATPLVLGQNELEGIGLDPRSRLRLVDAQAGLELGGHHEKMELRRAEVRSITAQLQALASQREGLRQQALVRDSVHKELEAARAAETAILGQASREVAELRERLSESSQLISDQQRGAAVLQSVIYQVDAVIDLEKGARRELAEAASELSVQESLSDVASDMQGLLRQHDAFLEVGVAVAARLRAAIQSREARVAALEDETRPFRRQFDELEVGAGAAAQRTALLERQLADIDQAQLRLQALNERTEQLSQGREELLGEIDRAAEGLWRQRQEAVTLLNSQFSPRIRVLAEHYGDRALYTGALASALRGSGLQYNQVADWLTERVSPEELVRAVEQGDASRLSIVGELTSSRVDKLVSHLAASEQLGDVLTAAIDDAVTLELLVGRDYRRSDELSTGQRCAVVLPLLLADEERLLMLDQPEDHLDNAYLVDNTVQSLLSRGPSAQTLVATHNANVPVLGDADKVLVLDSDGRRGYVRLEGPLLLPEIVEAITDLMEGGRAAFQRRAAFYGGDQLV